MMGGRRHANTRPGAWDPKARLADLTLDHIKAEVMYPGGFGLQFWAAPDAEYQAECCRVFNDWVSEFCAADPDRFLGAALIPMRGPIELAVKETHRAAKLKGIKNPFRVEFQVVNLDRLGELFPEGGTIGVEELIAKGLVRKGHPVKVLGQGDIDVKVQVSAQAFSASAKQKIEAAGGSTTVV